MPTALGQCDFVALKRQHDDSANTNIVSHRDE